MPIETLDDIVEELADNLCVYGAHSTECRSGRYCRCCWTSALKERVRAAVSVERRLAKGDIQDGE